MKLKLKYIINMVGVKKSKPAKRSPSEKYGAKKHHFRPRLYSKIIQWNIFTHVLCSLASRWCCHQFGVCLGLGHCNNDIASNTQCTHLYLTHNKTKDRYTFWKCAKHSQCGLTSTGPMELRRFMSCLLVVVVDKPSMQTVLGWQSSALGLCCIIIRPPPRPRPRTTNCGHK